MPPPASYRADMAASGSSASNTMNFYGTTMPVRRNASGANLAAMANGTGHTSPRARGFRLSSSCVVKVDAPKDGQPRRKDKVSPRAMGGFSVDQDVESQARQERFRLPHVSLWLLRLRLLLRTRPTVVFGVVVMIVLASRALLQTEAPVETVRQALFAASADEPLAQVVPSEEPLETTVYPSWADLGNAHVLLTEFPWDWKPLQNSFYLRHLEALTIPALSGFHAEGAKFLWLIRFPEGLGDGNFAQEGDYQRVLDLGASLDFAIVLTGKTAKAPVRDSPGTDLIGEDVRALCAEAMHHDEGATFPYLDADMFLHEQMLSITYLPPGVGLSDDFLLKVQRKIQAWNAMRRERGTWPPPEASRAPLPVPKEFASLEQQLTDSGGEGAAGPAQVVCNFDESHWMMQRSPTASGFISSPRATGQCRGEGLTVTMGSSDRVQAFKANLIVQGSTRWFRGMEVDLAPYDGLDGDASPFTVMPQLSIKDYSSFNSKNTGFRVDGAKLLAANRFVNGRLKNFEDLNKQLESEAEMRLLAIGLGA